MEKEPFDDMRAAMVTRGLLLTLSHIDVGSVSWHTVTLSCLRNFVRVMTMGEAAAKVVARQPLLVLIDVITQLQELLTNMVLFSSGRELFAELFEAAVRTLGFIREVNSRYRPEKFQIDEKEFVNSEVSQTLDFSGVVRAWSRQMLSRARNQKPIPIKTAEAEVEQFSLIEHPWLFTTEAKQRILKEHV